MVWCGMVWYGMVWYGMVPYAMVLFGLAWYLCCRFGHSLGLHNAGGAAEAWPTVQKRHQWQVTWDQISQTQHENELLGWRWTPKWLPEAIVDVGSLKQLHAVSCSLCRGAHGLWMGLCAVAAEQTLMIFSVLNYVSSCDLLHLLKKLHDKKWQKGTLCSWYYVAKPCLSRVWESEVIHTKV